MFLMTRRAGTALRHVRFVKAMFLMAAFAFGIDRFDGNAMSKTISHYFAKLSANGSAVVTLFAVVSELRVSGRNFAGVKKCLAPAAREKKNREQATEDCK